MRERTKEHTLLLEELTRAIEDAKAYGLIKQY